MMLKTELKDLRESNEFLNLLLDNINSAILIADENLQIHHFNNSFLDLFDKAADAFISKGFGEATGCVNAVVENKSCGATSACAHCLLRKSLIQTMVQKAPVDRQHLDRTFYHNGKPVRKNLEFSTRRIGFHGRDMFLIIIYDITEIEQQKIELQNKQKLIEADLRAASAIQQSLLPEETLHIEGIRTAWQFEPCAQIGGDIFNLIEFDESHAGIYMLDVCGHGVPAAFMAVAASQFLRGGRGLLGKKTGALSTENLLQRLNRAFAFERFDSFFSIVCLKLNIKDGSFSYSSAGHPPLVLLRTDGTTEILDHHGPVIGSSNDVTFGNDKKKLYKNDKLLLYTDGIYECRNSTKEIFGKNRFYETIEEHRHLPLRELVDAVFAGAKAFLQGARPEDDISLLGVEYTGTQSILEV
jgi:sigma-B regulation protein RsbU (phosphoserine phosphatase)